MYSKSSKTNHPNIKLKEHRIFMGAQASFLNTQVSLQTKRLKLFLTKASLSYTMTLNKLTALRNSIREMTKPIKILKNRHTNQNAYQFI